MPPTILLFDIDGTLIDSGGAGRRAMERAFARVTGRAGACAAIAFGGMTDRAIAREGLAAVRREADPSDIDALIAAYLEILEAEMPHTPSYTVHRGVHAILAEVGRRPGVAVGLGTGNVRRGAQLKLERGEIYGHFGFGGFGCDHEDRGELLRIGAQRGAARLGAALEACRVVVIGDTPRDIAAARAIGAECVAVATGPFDLAALSAHAPTVLVESLASPAAVGALLDPP